MSTSAANNAYIALTPNHADFMVPHSDRAPEGSGGHHRLVSDVDFKLGGQEPKWRTMLGKAKEMVENNIGLLCVTASMAFFAMMDVAVKKLHNIDPPVSTLQLVAVRMGITYICCLIYVVSVGIPDPLLGPKGVRLLLVFRGLSGFFSLFCIYYSLKYLSLADATVLTFLAPFCTGVAGALFLKEDFTKKEAFASLFSLCGVVLIARPVFLFGDNSGAPDSISADSGDGLQLDSSEKGTPTERLIAVGVALVGVLGSTGAYTSLRAIGKRAHTLHSIMAFSIASISISAPTMIATHTPFIIPTRVEWLLLFLMVGTFGFIAQVFLAMGLQRETAGRGSMGAYTQVIFAVILEQIFFKTTPSILSVIGTLIIMTSAFYVAVTKAQPKKAESSSISLETIHEDSLEEGLLEGTKHEEDSKSPSLSPLDRDFTSPKTAST